MATQEVTRRKKGKENKEESRGEMGRPLFDALIHQHAYDPHQVLGLHPLSKEKKCIRLYRPGALELHIEVKGEMVKATQVHPAGIFECIVPSSIEALDYRVYHSSGLLAYDPYAFFPTLGELDCHLFSRGVHYELYNALGGRLGTFFGAQGARFAVWAPNAKSVSLVGDVNLWDGRSLPMRSLGSSGIWELFVPGMKSGDLYKFEIQTKEGERKIKNDPYGLFFELRPKTASILFDVNKFQWEDAEWLQKRERFHPDNMPMSIYEVHLGSWKKGKSWQQMGEELGSYALKMGFTHVELLPVMEHPLDESWGYQVTGFFAPTSRFGTPDDFQAFVNTLHKYQIGIILDWVPGHFPTDDFSLAWFDGTALYEHADPRQGFHPHWYTHIFNYSRPEVRNFLIASALFWLEKMHIDGLRVDAVASMLYLDYGRAEGEWIPNSFGGRENLEAIEFLKHVNSVVHSKAKGALMIAEESTAFPAITHSLAYGGMGFDLKWNMGWMNDTLHYIAHHMFERKHHHKDLTFGLLYAFSERFALVLSHDEVVHGKKSLMGRMPGWMDEQFANLRLLISYMFCQPGKKLLFMGAEIAQWNEWNASGEIEWFLLNFPTHRGVQDLVADLNHFYRAHSALWERDNHWSGFSWVMLDDHVKSVVAYLRKSRGEELLCVHNFTAEEHARYFLPLGNVRAVELLFNSDDPKYGGWGKSAPGGGVWLELHGLYAHISPLATMVFKVIF